MGTDLEILLETLGLINKETFLEKLKLPHLIKSPQMKSCYL